MTNDTNQAPGAPTLNGQILSLDAYLNDPKFFARLVGDFAQTNPVGAMLLKGRQDVTGSGALLYEGINALYADGLAQIVDQLGDYPMVMTGNGIPNVAATIKSGLATQFSDELAARSRFYEAQKKVKKLVNSVDLLFENTCVSAISSAVSGTIAATAVFNSPTTTTRLYDIQAAIAQVVENGQANGLAYNPDVVVARPTIFAGLVVELLNTKQIDPAAAATAARLGQVVALDGVTYARANSSFGGGTKVFVGDSTELGGIATESLGGQYVKTDESDALSIEVFVERLNKRDGWHAQVRRVAVPFVTDPGAGVWITGAHS